MFSKMVLDGIGIGPTQGVGQPQEMWQETERASVLLPIPRSAAEEKGVSRPGVW